MEQKPTSGWTERNDGRYERNFVHESGDTIEVKRTPVEANDEREVIGRIGDQIYHTTHTHERAITERVKILKQIAEHEVSFDVGDDVFVVSDGFEPVVQRGQVALNREQYQSISVQFGSDPFDADDDGSRILDCHPSEMLHVDADAVESLSFIGRHDLLEVGDL